MKMKHPSATRCNRVLDIRPWLFAAVTLSLCFFAGRAVQAQTTTQEAEGNVEIWLNNTVDTSDDIVAQGGSKPCQVHLKNAQKDMRVVLFVPPISGTDVRKRLSLSATGVTNNADGSLPLTLAKDGTWRTFSIGGAIGSDAVGDAVVEAHKDSVSGDIKKTASASVYWFKNPHMIVTKGGNYPQSSEGTPLTSYLASGQAVYLKAQVQLQPSGLPTSTTPELATLGIGIVQNASANSKPQPDSEPSSGQTTIYGNPQFFWITGAKSGDVASYPAFAAITAIMPYTSNDSSQSVTPLYAGPLPISSQEVSWHDNPGVQATDWSCPHLVES